MEDKVIGYYDDNPWLDDYKQSKLKSWEAFCEGTYPGYGATEFEARAYASVTEILDEAELHDVVAMLEDRCSWAIDPPRQHRVYEEDDRITALTALLLHHGWEPPVNIAYTNMSGDHVVQPHDLERIDYGEMMQDSN